jgi:signal transduction histidine kinase
MDITQPCPLAADLAASMRDASVELTQLWRESIAARTRDSADSADNDFPSDELLDHMRILLDGIAAYLEEPTDPISVDVPVIAEAMELAALRFNQGFDARDVLEEYEILGDVLFSFSARMISASGRECSAGDLLVCSHRIFRALTAIEHATTAHYLRVLGERVAEREERLRRFNRMITHELKNRVGATLGAGQLLQEEWLETAERTRFAGMVTDNARAIQKVIENLTALSRIDGEKRRQRNIALSEAVANVMGQLRGLARARGVDLRIVGEIPAIDVNAADVELCLSNYLSNSIRYSDPAARPSWAEVSAAVEDVPDGGGEQLVVRVRDNGLGVQEDVRDQLFARYFRAHTDVGSAEGTGLGLSIVKETMVLRGGGAWAEFADPPGALFAFSLPCEDAACATAGGVSDSAGAATSNGVGHQPDAARARASD